MLQTRQTTQYTRGGAALAEPNLQVFSRVSVGDTEVEACFPFRHEMDSCVPFWGIGDDLCFDGGSPELVLLWATPPVGVGQHELNAPRHRIPAVLPDLVGGNKHRFRRVEEITHEIGEYVDNGFSPRKFFAHLILQDSRRLIGSKHKLPPVTVSSYGLGIKFGVDGEPSHLDETFVILKSPSVLNALEATVPVVIEDRRDFCRSNVWIVEVPVSGSR